MTFYNHYSKEHLAGLFSHEMRFNNSTFSNRLLTNAENGLEAIQQYAYASEEFSNLTSLQKAQWLECKSMLAGYLLSTQGDRMSFAHGVETRLPFLDFNVINWASSLPVELRLKDNSYEKYILRKSFRNKLPESILNKQKKPYRAPDASSFLHLDKKPEYLDSVLSKEELKKITFVNTDFALNLVDKLVSLSPEQISQRENQTFVFLLSIVLLYRNFVINLFELPNSEISNKLLVKKVDGRALQTVV